MKSGGKRSGGNIKKVKFDFMVERCRKESVNSNGRFRRK